MEILYEQRDFVEKNCIPLDAYIPIKEATIHSEQGFYENILLLNIIKYEAGFSSRRHYNQEAIDKRNRKGIPAPKKLPEEHKKARRKKRGR